MLPNNFQPRPAADLIRLGKNNDGGYLVDKSSVLNSDYLLSFGISVDWSFEAQFYGVKKVPISAYDGTVNLTFWLFLVIKSAIKVFIPGKKGNFFSTSSKALNFYRFFSKKNRRFYSKMIGIGEQRLNLDEIMRQNANPQNVFLKIDIEGAEYQILNQIIKHQNHLTALAIEFHDVSKHRAQIEQFIEMFTLELIHVHANNYGSVDPNGDPNVLEMTFAKTIRPTDKGIVNHLPNKLDQPNDPNAPEISLQFGTENPNNP